MYTLVCSRPADERGLFRIIRISLRYRTGCNKSLEQVALDRLLVMCAASVSENVPYSLQPTDFTHSCMPLYPVPEYPINTATFFLGLLSSAASTSSENFV